MIPTVWCVTTQKMKKPKKSTSNLLVLYALIGLSDVEQGFLNIIYGNTP